MEDLSDSVLDIVNLCCLPVSEEDSEEATSSFMNLQEEADEVAMIARIAVLESELRSRDRTLMDKETR